MWRGLIFWLLGVSLGAAPAFAKVELTLVNRPPVVIDEVAGVLIAWTGAPLTLFGAIAGLVLFRIFDHTKPWPARLAEQRLPLGYSVMFDDVVAGAWAALLLFGAHHAGLL